MHCANPSWWRPLHRKALAEKKASQPKSSTSSGSRSETRGPKVPKVPILRIARSGTTYKFGWSPLNSQGGRVWHEATIAPGFTATQMGLFVFNSTGAAVELSFEFFRYYASATALTGGAP